MIAEGLPPEIALKECRLNLLNQYSETLAFFLVDMPMLQIRNEIALEVFHESMNEMNNRTAEELGVDLK